MEKTRINTDCIYLNGYGPCKAHKEKGVKCENCKDYLKAEKNILIIKLGAAGEVVRCTPILRKLKESYPNARIFWLTDYPELIPKKYVHRIYKLNEKSKEVLRDIEFDIVYSLDKHEEMGAFANSLKAKIKKGFSQKNGVVIPFDKDAHHKFKTGIFDDLMKANKKHYIEEIFEICGFKFNEEKYVLPEFKIPDVKLEKKKIIALNTGAGKAWLPRIYSENNWIKLAKLLKAKGYEVFIAGGKEEDEKNKRIAKKSGAKYFGTFDYLEFIGLLSLADVIVTSVTFAFHAGVGLGKKIILLNNTFNKHEFYMYGNGTILEPDLPCLMCYKNKADEKCPNKNCMDLISPEKILTEISREN